jgi:hypothetical protein
MSKNYFTIITGWMNLERRDVCKELAGKKYIEVIADEKLRKQFYSCLKETVFRIDGLSFGHDKNYLIIRFMTEFFEKPDFHYGGKPSDTRLKKFYEILITLEKESKCRFIVDRSTKLSSTNLNLGLKFPLFKIGKLDNIVINDLISYLSDLWIWLCDELSTYGYKIRGMRPIW